MLILFIGFADDGVDPWESEDYDDEEGMADEAEALDNGWMDSQLSEESPKSHANRQQLQQQTPQQQQPMSDGPAVGDLAVVPLPDPPRTGILKGGKLWRGAVNNNNNSNDSSQNNSSSTSSSAGPSSIGEEATLSRHGEKSPAVRFIHLNDAQCGADSEDGGANATATNCNATGGAASGGGQSQRSGGGGGTGHHHNSAFQQLFPRARKLLQELPEAEIQRLTTAARANNAPSSVSSVSSFASSSSRTGVTSLLGHSADSATDTTDASDLK